MDDVNFVPCSAIAAFEETSLNYSDRIAIFDGERKLSYRQLDEAATTFSASLRPYLTRPNQPVALLMERSAEMVVAMLAVWKSGGYYVPLSLRDPSLRLQTLIGSLGVSLMIGREAEELEGVRCLPPPGGAQDANDRKIETTKVYSESLAYVMFTSGSTGEPKPVGTTHGNIVAFARQSGLMRPGAKVRTLLHSPYTFDASTFELWVPLLTGGSVVVAPQGDVDLQLFSNVIKEKSITTLFLTTGLFHTISKEEPQSLSGLKELFVGGEVLQTQALDRFKDVCRQVEVYNCYGPTETTAFVTTYKTSDADSGKSSIPIGRPLGHARAYVLDDRVCLAEADQVGELYIGGCGLALGYVGNPMETAERFIANPLGSEGERVYRTGDLASIDHDGQISFHGRSDQQVKIRGYRVEIFELEFHLSRISGISHCAVKAIEDNEGSKVLVAYLVRSSAVVTKATIADHIKQTLPYYMQPSYIEFVTAIPLKENGKVDREALPSPTVTLGAGGAAGDEYQLIVLRIFKDVLGMDEIGTDDNFFTLGGHSLMAAKIVSRIKKATEAQISMRDIFDAPTVRGLAIVIYNRLK
ncbi:non-ribosomal peptide synthetase [Notoacmeibacter marinus]|uniref:non-ribosomal peptide synthetase n=1 Tax=Notoacmeibacter marinus TaxID=1876515 RepID=UPI0013B06588|nr:non-ribosomal peptide synthetase [Notoacmeibacter marinus]